MLEPNKEKVWVKVGTRSGRVEGREGRTARHGARGGKRVKQNCGYRWDGGGVSAENSRNYYIFSKVITGHFHPWKFYLES